MLLTGVVAIYSCRFECIIAGGNVVLFWKNVGIKDVSGPRDGEELETLHRSLVMLAEMLLLLLPYPMSYVELNLNC